MYTTREAAYDTVHDAQRHFRVLLDAMARPGTLAHLQADHLQPPADLHRASALVGLALLDADAAFYVAADAAREYLLVNTGAPLARAENADFLFVDGTQGAEACRQAKIGTLRYPEGGATLVVDVERLAPAPAADALTLTLTGPGIDGEGAVAVRGLSEDILAGREEKNDEFPTGIDLILSDGEGQVCCLPRTAKVRWNRA